LESPVSISTGTTVYAVTDSFAGLELISELTGTGASKFYIGSLNNINVRGDHTNSWIYGFYSLANNRFATGSGTKIIGANIAAQVEAAAASVVGASIGAIRGNINSTPLITGLEVVAYNGYSNATELIAQKITIGGQSSPATVALGKALQIRAINSGGAHAWTELRGISLDTWTWGGTETCALSYGIYADATIDKGTTKYFIYSLSTSPSIFTGSISVPDAAYGAGWDGSLEVPTKNAVYDKIEALIIGGGSGDAVLAGQSGGQILHGGTDAGDDLTLRSTSHATKGSIFIGAASAYDHVNERLGVGTLAPVSSLEIISPMSTQAFKATGTQLTPANGAGSGTTAGNFMAITAPAGQASSSTTGSTFGGQGGLITVNAGVGGAHSGIPASGFTRGGAGGTLTFTGGTGGANTAGSGDNRGGTGGGATVSGGTGGATNGAGAAGNGGGLTLFAGGGGNATAAGGTAGTGGVVAISGGAAGVASGGAAGSTHGGIRMGDLVNFNSFIVIGHSTITIGFFGAAPVVQPNGTGETTGFTAGAGTPVLDDSTFTGNVGTKAYRISDIVKALKNLGLIASS
jgi:hypothetical protein